MRTNGGHGPWPGCFSLACFAIAAGCGGGGGSSDSSGVTMQPIQAADCAWRSRCALGDCAARTCDAPILRANAVAAAVRCYESLACDGSDDDCELAAFEQVPNAEADIDSCLQSYRASCPQCSDIDESLCLAYPLLIPSKQAEFHQCFEQSTCAESCIAGVAALCSG